MFIVNAGPGFQKILWPAAQKFLDAKTIGKIQVEESRGFFSSTHLVQLQLTEYLCSHLYFAGSGT